MVKRCYNKEVNKLSKVVNVLIADTVINTLINKTFKRQKEVLPPLVHAMGAAAVARN